MSDANQQPIPSTEFKLIIVTPDEVIMDTLATRVMAPGYFQELAILPDHTPMYNELKKGSVLVTTKEGNEKSIEIEEGVIRVKQNKVSILIGY